MKQHESSDDEDDNAKIAKKSKTADPAKINKSALKAEFEINKNDEASKSLLSQYVEAQKLKARAKKYL
jgi:hypothetical protein